MNNYRDRIIALHIQQTNKGLEKYGTVLEQNADDAFKRLEHFRQEMLDGLNYSFWLEDELKRLGLIEAKDCSNCTKCFESMQDGCELARPRIVECKENNFCFWEG